MGVSGNARGMLRRRTYHFDLHGAATLRSDVHGHSVIIWLVVGAIMREDEGDVDGAIVRLQREVVGCVLARAHVFYSVRACRVLQQAFCAHWICRVLHICQTHVSINGWRHANLHGSKWTKSLMMGDIEEIQNSETGAAKPRRESVRGGGICCVDRHGEGGYKNRADVVLAALCQIRELLYLPMRTAGDPDRTQRWRLHWLCLENKRRYWRYAGNSTSTAPGHRSSSSIPCALHVRIIPRRDCPGLILYGANRALTLSPR